MRPYMTEEEANTKWCPVVRQTDHGELCTTNRAEIMGADKVTCIGSGCMWWGWEPVNAGYAGKTILSTTTGRCEAPGSDE